MEKALPIKTKRNESVDMLRGIAMLMVVMGHTMTGASLTSQNSFLFNFIWSLQMPLFMLISGYVLRYSRSIRNAKQLLQFICRRTMSYLLPWISWSVLVRGFVFNEPNYLKIKWLAYNMDSGYWFLFSIWNITMFFGISQFVANKLVKSEKIITNTIILLITFASLSGLLAIVGLKFGLSFLCIKLTLYYTPIYILGFLFGKFQSLFTELKYSKIIVEFIVFLSLVIFILFLNKVDLYTISDSPYNIALRFVTSILGCIAICGIFSKITDTFKFLKFLNFAGVHSLEIYLIHGLVLSFLLPSKIYSFSTLQGYCSVLIVFSITIVVTFLLTYILNLNKVSKFILFGKNK